MDKRFIITDENDNFEKLEETVGNFIIEKFKKENTKDISFDVDYGEYDYDDKIVGELRVIITFEKYKYKNNNEEETENIMIVFEDKYLQPFYIDGKFVTKNIYEWTAGCPIQKTKEIYGYDKDILYEMFEDYIMTC